MVRVRAKARVVQHAAKAVENVPKFQIDRVGFR